MKPLASTAVFGLVPLPQLPNTNGDKWMRQAEKWASPTEDTEFEWSSQSRAEGMPTDDELPRHHRKRDTDAE